MTAAPVVLPRQITQALEHIESLCNFAYEQGFHELGYDPVEALRVAIASGSVVCRAADEWKCGSKSSVGANDPQECNWPMCGCDPYADKVIAALQECGALKEKSNG